MKKLINQISMINKYRLILYILICSVTGGGLMATGNIDYIIVGCLLFAISIFLGLIVGINDNTSIIEKIDNLKSEVRELTKKSQLTNDAELQDKVDDLDKQLDGLVDEFQSNVSLKRIEIQKEGKSKEEDQINITKLWKSKIVSMIKQMDSYIIKLNQIHNKGIKSTIQNYPINFFNKEKPLYTIQKHSHAFLNIFFRPINDHEIVIIFTMSSNSWNEKTNDIATLKTLSLFLNENDKKITDCRESYLFGFYGFQTNKWDGYVYSSLNELGRLFIKDLIEFIYALDSPTN